MASNRQHPSDRSDHVVDEQTPLLLPSNIVAPTTDPDVAAEISNRRSKNHDDDDEQPPHHQPQPQPRPHQRDQDDGEHVLPKRQILLLCYARMVEPIAFFSIFPYVNQMVQRNGSVPDAQVGFYSGLIESLFSLTQMSVMIFWGRASDALGRKPVLVASLLGVSVTTSLFGFAGTIWQMILFRCLAGVFAGTVVTIRTMLSELSTRRTQARTFSLFQFANNVGIFLGPLVGGALADPAEQYGGVFDRVWFFRRFPYALPTLTTAFFGFTAFVVVAMFVDETLHSKKRNKKRKSDGEANPTNTATTTTTNEADDDNDLSNNPKKKMTTWQLLREPGVSTVLYLQAHMMTMAFSYTAVIPVFWFEPISLGGFGFTSFQISLFMAVTGASQAIWTLLIFPPLQHRFSTGWVLRACGVGWTFLLLIYPLLNVLLRHATSPDPAGDGGIVVEVEWELTLFWILAPILIAVGVGVSIGYTAIQLAINDISPSPETLGTLNAVALASVSGVRSFTPALFTSIYAVGVERQILGGQMGWFVLFVIALGYLVAVQWLPERAEGRVDKDD